MARKPFLPTHTGKNWSIGFTTATQRPELLTIIGECITGWPHVEHYMALLLGRLLGTNSESALAMFSALRQFRVQQDAVQSAASVTLDETDQELIAAVFDVLRTAQKSRDDLAHGHWGVCDEMPDALLWVEAKHHGPWNVQAILKGPVSGPSHDELAKHFFVYTRQDLLEVRDTIQQAWSIMHDVLSYLGNKQTGHPASAKLLAQLCSEPPIREALARLAKRKSR